MPQLQLAIPNMQSVAAGGRPNTSIERYKSRDGTLGDWETNQPDSDDRSESGEYWPVSRLRQCYLDYLGAKVLEYEEQQQARHYYHAAQWTPEEIKILRARRQPIITFNRTARKIDQIVGIVSRLHQEPKAYPRNPKNADGAGIATEAVRYVCDANDWEFLDAYCAGQCAIEGIGGVELKLIDGDHDDPDVGMDFIFGDDFFYDPRSYKPDFSDARYMGIAKWLDVEAAVELFPDKEDEIRGLMTESGFDLTTHSDREYKWVYVNEKRLRLVEIWYQSKGKWYWSFFCSMFELDRGISPFLDERNRPMNRFVMFSGFVDHDGDRYGFPRNLKGPQDELNQRRSKTLFMSNVTRLISQKGAVDNVETARREYARPDGFIEYNPGFQPPVPDTASTSAQMQSQLALMQDARLEIDSFANVTPDLITRDVPGEHSGVAINMLQRAGIAELGPFLRNYKAWKKRLYRTSWNIIKRTWQKERFLRVTDDQGLDAFLQLNGTDYDEFGNPLIVNAIGNIEVEMTLDDGPDEANMMQDAYDVLKGYPPGMIPPAVLIELSPLSSKVKRRVLALMNQPVDEYANMMKQIALANANAEVNLTNSKAERSRSQTVLDAAKAGEAASKGGLNSQEAWERAFLRTDEQATPPSGKTPGASSPENFGDFGSPAMPPGPGGPGGGAPPGSATPPGGGNVVPMQSPVGGAGPGGMGGLPGVPPGDGRSPGIGGAPANNPAEALLRRARRAPDGKHYVPDPRRPGKYLMVA